MFAWPLWHPVAQGAVQRAYLKYEHILWHSAVGIWHIIFSSTPTCNSVIYTESAQIATSGSHNRLR